MIDKNSATWEFVQRQLSLRIVDARAELENELTDDRRTAWLRGRISALNDIAGLAEEKRIEAVPSDEY